MNSGAKTKDNVDEPSWLHEDIPDPSPSQSPFQSNLAVSANIVESKVSPNVSDVEANIPSWVDENKFETHKTSGVKPPRLSETSILQKEKPPSRMSPFPSIEVFPSENRDYFICCGCRIDPVLIGFLMFRIINICAALASISANFYVFTSMTLKDDVREILLRLYGVLFGFISALIETDMDIFLDYFQVFHSWFARGLWLAFIGLLTGSTRNTDTLYEYQYIVDYHHISIVRLDSTISSAENVIGFVMMALGLSYAVMVADTCTIRI